MIPVLTAAEMREADRRTIEDVGVPGVVLMENAGAAVARALREHFPAARRLTVLCGKGNNGGDGFVVARRLAVLQPAVYLVGSRHDVKGDALVQMGAFERSGGAVVEIASGTDWEGIRERVLEADVIVDALLGTGLREQPSGVVGLVLRDLLPLVPGKPPCIVAVDIPSGLSSDTGEVAWEVPTATLTVAFGAPKHGHVLPPACAHVGTLIVADIGIPGPVLADVGARLFLSEPSDAAAPFEPRAVDSHKGSYGHLLVIAGSVGKTGAAVLAAMGALRSGVGLVTVATPAPALSLVAAARPEIMTEALSVNAAGLLTPESMEHALALAKTRDAVVLGPGLGQETATRDFVRGFTERCPLPLLVDADGLNALAAAPAGPELLHGRSAPTVVTPHPGEMARLAGGTAAEVQRKRLETARAFAVRAGAIVVLKGYRTLVASPQGRTAVNPTGNPGMATGGTGDVLSGVIGALLARGDDAWRAAAAGVYVHGLAGDLAAARRGQDSLVAGDLVEDLSEAIGSVTRSRA